MQGTPTPSQKAAHFPGFSRPEQNWFKLPNDWTNITADITSLAELKLVEYVLKHTWGYQEYGLTKQITTDEFMHGRRRKDGHRMDKGTGLSNRSVIDGLKKAVEHGFLIEDVDDSDKGRVKKCYALKMLSPDKQEPGPPGEPPTDTEPSRAGVKNLHTTWKNLHPDVKNLHPRCKESSHRTEKDTLERHFIKPLNGDISIFKTVPKLPQPNDKTAHIAEQILEQLGDAHSTRFYQMIAARVPEDVIYQALAEVKADGAHNPGALFTHKMKTYALKQQKNRIGNR